MSSIAVMSLARSKSAATSWTTNREVDAGDQEHEHLAYRQNGEHRRLGGDVGEVLYRHEHGAEEIEHHDEEQQDDAGTGPYECERPPERPLRVQQRPRTGNSSLEGAHAVPGPTGCQGPPEDASYMAGAERTFYPPRTANAGNPQVAPPSSTPPWIVPIPLARMLLTPDTRVNSTALDNALALYICSYLAWNIPSWGEMY